MNNAVREGRSKEMALALFSGLLGRFRAVICASCHVIDGR